MPATTQQDAALIAREIGTVMSKMLTNHQTFLKGLSDDRGSRRDIKGEKGNSPTSSMNINRRLSGSIKRLTSNVEKSSGLFAALNKHLKESSNSKKQDNNVSDKQQSRVQKNQLRYIKYMAQHAKGSKHLADSLLNSNKQIEKGGKKAEGELSSFGEAVKKYGTSIVSKLGIGKGIGTMFNDLQTAMSTSNIYDVEQTNKAALSMGVTVKDLISLQSTYRRDALRSSAGIQDWTNTIKTSQLDLLTFTGSMVEAAKASAAIRSTIMDVGISFDEATDVIGSGQNGLVGQLKQLSSATGKTIMELNDGMRSIISGDETRFMLQKMDKTQRASYLLDQATARTRYTLLTGSLEKADELIKSQQAEGRKGYKERFIEAAKLQAAAVRAGVDGGDARRMTELMQKNPALRTETERAELLQLRSSLSDIYSQLSGSGDPRTEMATNIIMDQLGLNTISDQNLSTYSGLDATATADHLKNNISATIDGNSLAKSALEWQQKIWNTLDNGFVQMMGGFLLLAAKGRGSPLDLFRRSGRGKGGFLRNSKAATSRLGKKTVGAISRVGSLAGLGAGGGTMGKTLLKGVGKGGLAGIASIGANMLVDQLIEPESARQEQGKNVLSGAISGAGYGAMIGSVVPVIGTAVGAAVGGVIGGIVGLMSETKTQIEYANDASLKAVDNKIKANEVAQSIENDRFTTENSKLSKQWADAVRDKDTDSAKEFEDKMNKANELHTTSMTMLQREHEIATKQKEDLIKIEEATANRKKFEGMLEDRERAGVFATGVKQFDAENFVEASGMSIPDLVADIQKQTGLDRIRAEKLTGQLTEGTDIERLGGTRESYEAIQQYITGGIAAANKITTNLQDAVTQVDKIESIVYDFGKGDNFLKSNALFTDLAALTSDASGGALTRDTLSNLDADTIKKLATNLTAEQREKYDTDDIEGISQLELLTAIKDILSDTRTKQRAEFDAKEARDERMEALARSNKFQPLWVTGPKH